jgi:hypothetical protein
MSTITARHQQVIELTRKIESERKWIETQKTKIENLLKLIEEVSTTQQLIDAASSSRRKRGAADTASADDAIKNIAIRSQNITVIWRTCRGKLSFWKLRSRL